MAKEISGTTLKGCRFLLREESVDQFFIAEEFTEEQKMISNLVHDFCMQEIHSMGIEKAAQLDASKDLPQIVAMLEKAGELGLCGLSIEEKYGGMGLDFNTGVLFSEAIAIGFSFATTLGAQTSIGSLPIVYYGTDEQKAKYLPKIATAEYKAAYCLTEPTAGSDANSGKSRAVLSEDKQHYMLNGQKMWITNGGFADIFIVFAKIEDDEDLSAFIVEKSFGGISLGKEEKKLGIKGSSTVQVFFSDCPVPAENLLGGRANGFKIALNILNTGRIKLAAGSVGGAKFGLTKAAEYASERKQFGKAIGEFGAIKYKIGRMATEAYATESALYRTGHNIDLKFKELSNAGKSRNESKLEAIREYAVECSLLKFYGSEILDYSVDEVLQIFGGMGYAVETGVEMGYRDARITRIYEGTNEINRLLSVGELMKRAFKTKEVNLAAGVKSLPLTLLSNLFRLGQGSGRSRQERMVKNIKAVFLLVSATAGRKLKLKMIDEQEIVMNLADILAEAFIADSTLIRNKKITANGLYKGEDLSIREDMLELFLYESLAKCRKLGLDAVASFASGMERRILSTLVKRLTPEYRINPKDTRRRIADFVLEKKAYPF